MTTKTPAVAGSLGDRNAAANAAWARFRRGGDPAAIADLFDLAAGDLHRTALHLVGDDATAHDLVQITFLALLQQRTFDSRRDVLPWLAGVLHNQAALVHRRRARAFDPDRLPPEPTEDPTERAAASELRAEIEAAIERLPDVYRPVVQLHLLHGLDAGAIAAALQRSGSTVRTQLVRGLEKMRGLLPIGLAGLVAGLMPNLGRAAVRQAVLDAARGSPAAAAIATWWLRPRTLFLGLGAAAAIATAALLANANGSTGSPAPNATATLAAPATPAHGSDAQVDPDPAAAGSSTDRTAVTTPAQAHAFALHGAVRGTVHGQDGMPVAGAEVLLWSRSERPVMNGRAFEPPPDDAATTGDDGAFEVHGRGDHCYLLARTQEAISEYGIRGALDGRDRVDGLEVPLGPLVVQRGRLLRPDGGAVANFAFGTHRGGSSSSSDRLPTIGFVRCELPHLDVRTDADGNFAALAAAGFDYLWEVQHPEHPMLRVRHRPADGPVDLRLETGAEIRGRALLAGGGPAPGARITLFDYPVRRTVADATGAFAFRGAWLREGLWLRADADGCAIHCAEVPSSEPLELNLEPARAIAGRVVDDDGNPVAGVDVHIVGDRIVATGARYEEPSTWEYKCGLNRATSAADGSFRFERLYDGMFAVELAPAGASEWATVARTRSGVESLELRTGAAIAHRATITGQLRDGITLRPIEAVKVTILRSDGDDRGWTGTVLDLAAPGGRYSVDCVAGRAKLTFAAAGHATVDLPPRELAAGVHVVDVTLHPARSVLVQVRGGNGGGQVSAHLGDGVPLQLPIADGLRSQSVDLVVDGTRVDGLPARPVTLVLHRGRKDPIEQVVDLTQPRTEPVVFEDDARPEAQPVEFGVLVFGCTRDADAATWAGTPGRDWFLRLQQNPAVAPLDAAARIRVTTASGTELATATIARGEPREVQPGVRVDTFDCRVHHADGQGQHSPETPVPGVTFRLPPQTIVVEVEAEGRAAERRTIPAGDLAGPDAAFAVFLRPK